LTLVRLTTQLLRHSLVFALLLPGDILLKLKRAS
jgi:hypothetical protein